MQSNIMFFQSTDIGGESNQIGLLDLLLNHINSLENVSIFEKIQVVVPNQAMAIWVKDKFTEKLGICANLDFVVLLGPVLENIYKANNLDYNLYDLNNLKYSIYDFLCKNKIKTSDANSLNYYIYVDGKLDKYRAFQLASQLQNIFQEYIYLRTDELLNLDKAKFPEWQKLILKHILKTEKQTFLDIYSFFTNSNLETLKLPKNLFIFGLTSVYPSQLHIVKRISSITNLYWYYRTCSYKYYGDLLSNTTKNKLERKVLKYPDLKLDDLYLTDGNQLLANLGQQSREFIELLQANDISVYSFNPEISKSKYSTILSIIQDDIRQLKYRVKEELRLNKDIDYYADPILVSKNIIPDKISDLSAEQVSVKVNICHNRMREVQVMFNEIANLLKTSSVSLDKILICAPDIDDYEGYIRAVFDNELIQNESGLSQRIPYNITGYRRHGNHKILETIKLFLNAPYRLTVSYFIEILTQTEICTNLNITQNDVDLIKKWLADNVIHFGYDENDYIAYGYINYPVHSFKQWLNNIVLGACLTEDIFTNNNQLPLYNNLEQKYCPYDNIDSKQIDLCNKMLMLINLLEGLRNLFYKDENTYEDLTIHEVHAALNNLHTKLIRDEDSILISEKFLGALLSINLDTKINLPILNVILNEYVDLFKSKINFDGRITCASMRYMRNIPFDHIYILGMNFGEFPQTTNKNHLNLLSKEWYLADRNYNIEDKQTFLDLILSAKNRLFLSYIGRKETDNSEIKPSTTLALFMTIIGQSFLDFSDMSESSKFDFKNILSWQSLHPFYNNRQDNFSTLWHLVSKQTGVEYQDKRWDFSKISPLKLSSEQKESYLNPTLKNLIETFLYTNKNLYSVLGIKTFNDEEKLNDIENLTLTSRNIAHNIFKYLDKYGDIARDKLLYEFLEARGIINYAHVGQLQFDYYSSLFQLYKEKRGFKEINISFQYNLNKDTSNIIQVNVKGNIWIDKENNIIVSTPFEAINDKPLAEKISELSYDLKIKAIILFLLIKNNAATDNGNIKIENVIIRQIINSGESRDFLVHIHDITQVNRIFAYYLRSLSNPILIHKKAIQTYADIINTRQPDGSYRYTIEDALEKAKVKYCEQFGSNPDLDKIKQDIIFGNINTNYFEYIASAKGINDIKYIGEILASLNGEN